MESQLEVESEQLTPAVQRRRIRPPVWDVKTEDDLNRVMAQCEIVKRGKRHVLRLKGWDSEHEPKHDHSESESHGEDLGPASEWDEIGERGETAKLIYSLGLKSKAYRYGRCGRYGIPLQGHDLACKFKEKSFGTYRCGLRFCDLCGPATYRRLFERYAPGIAEIVLRESWRKGYVLARVNFTIRASGEMPSSEEIRQFNRAIRKLFKRVLPKGAVFGVIWSDEFGFEERGHIAERKAGGLNLHAHGDYFGPYIDWQKTRDAWIEIMGDGSRGFVIKAIRGWRRNVRKEVSKALGHCLKYVSKMPAVSPERIAGFEKAFDGVRRVHSMGLFYKLPPAPKQERRCPECGNILFPVRPFGLSLVSDLLASGYVDVDRKREGLNRSRVFGGGP